MQLTLHTQHNHKGKCKLADFKLLVVFLHLQHMFQHDIQDRPVAAGKLALQQDFHYKLRIRWEVHTSIADNAAVTVGSGML